MNLMNWYMDDSTDDNDYIEEKIVELEPCHSKVTASSCTSNKVVKVVAEIMEKRLLKEENKNQKTINVIGKENLPIATRSEDLEDGEFKSGSANRTCARENKDVVVTRALLDVVMQNESDDNVGSEKSLEII
ncbi:hypothetical protein C2G38_2038625 [Gigaspora rosea]|uniref:Uncharacterized protein n=1 Tax=Gigaspora rosea TaxID=44941 RepID=A0A397V1R7_9GLOM|nr:hypothetical protein C2G38_2038625 [Gigaspora rosea]